VRSLRAPATLAVTLLLMAAGYLLVPVAGLGDVHLSPEYRLGVTVLLAIGLFSSTYAIPLAEIRRNARTIVLAVTVGVLVKAALISAFMYVAFRNPAYLLLGVVVAQIDPLSTAALRDEFQMSRSARSLLSAWASFDDPVTTILAVYLATVVGYLVHGAGASTSHGPIGDLRSISVDLGLNLAFVVGAAVCWVAVRGLSRLAAGGPATAQRPWGWSLVTRSAPVLVLLALGVVAVQQFLMLGLAVTGLFFRPALDRSLRRLTQAAFLLAALMLGLLLDSGVQFLHGIALGVAAYLAQLVVGLLIARRHPLRDRGFIALGQQNGVTAIILAILLEPAFPGTAAVIAPAIATVNILYIVANGVWSRVADRVAPAAAAEELSRG
jgi:NhaP-type Na+/H+ or K+/H+ antiporter